MKRRATSPTGSPRPIPMDRLVQTPASPQPAATADGQEAEKRKRSIPGERSLRFDLPPEDPVTSWLEKLSYVEETPPLAGTRFGASAGHDEDIDTLLHAGPRFSDLIRSTSTDSTAGKEATAHRREPSQDGSVEPSPMPMSAIAPSGMASGLAGGGRFDEDEIRNRRRIHYRAHQPLKSLEPKVLRKFKDRIEWGRSQAQMARTAGVQKAPDIVVNADEQHATADNGDVVHSRRPHTRRRRRRRRRRSKKSEPFQPTLGHVSEEQQSGLDLDEEDDEDDADDDDDDDDDEDDEEDEEDDDEEEEEEEELLEILASAEDVALEESSMSQTTALDDVQVGVHEAGKPALACVGSADGHRPSFQLGGDSNRNSEVNLTGMAAARSPLPHQCSVESCTDTSCCRDCPDGKENEAVREGDIGTSSRHSNRSTTGRHHHHHHHHHHREHFSKKDLQERCFSGAELRQITEAQRSNSQAPTEPEEAQCLKAKDLDEMNYHRLEKHQLKHHRHKPPSSARLPASVMSVVEVGHMEHGLLASDLNHVRDGSGSPLPAKLTASPSAGAFRMAREVDHRPHDVFVELDELTLTDQAHRYLWKEKARWIRFEEDLVEGGERWGKPHVAPLSFQSLLQMRSLLESATFIKDLEATDLVTIADAVYNQLVHTHSSSIEEAQSVRQMLLLKHTHVGGSHHHHQSSAGAGKRAQSPPGSMHDRNMTSPALLAGQSVVDDSRMPKFDLITTEPSHMSSHTGLLVNQAHAQRRRNSLTAALHFLRRRSTPTACLSGRQNGDVQITMESDGGKATSGSLSAATMGQHKQHKRSILDIWRHSGGVNDLLTSDCEVVSSLVGSCPFIAQTRTVLIRLAQGVHLPKLSEVDRPIRFIFLFLVTNQQPLVSEYVPREIGRVFATLMADQDFHEIAYKAECKDDMVAGLRDFLEKSIVLPPGEWDRQTLLPVVNYQRDRLNKMRSLKEQGLSLSAADGSRTPVPHLYSADGVSEELEPLMMRQEGDRTVPTSEKELPPSQAPSEKDVDKGDVASVVVKRSRTCRSMCRPFKGLRNDAIRFTERYLSDWRDPVRSGMLDVIIASLFVFFVVLAPSITFGALMESLVNPVMSMDKSLVSAGIFLMLVTLTGGQPQMVVGVTGPVFIIETTIGMLANTMDVDYICLRFLVAMFASMWGFIFLTFNLASFLEVVPRSLEEVFNMFVAIFFCFKSAVTVMRPLAHTGFHMTIANETGFRMEHNTTLVLADAFQHFATSNSTALVAVGTYMLVMTLSNVKKGKMFTRRVRWFLGSFAVPMSILIMAGVGNLLFGSYPLRTLQIPASASNPATWLSMPNFSLISKFDISHWMLALLIGVCLHMLTFTETGMCGLTLAKREQGLVKPTLFHLNVLIVNAVFPLISGFFCWPFMTGAVVRSNAHTLALQVWEDRTLPGVRRRLVGVREQRISGCLVGLFVFLCVFLAPLLKFIPMGAMYGMFFYMGVASFRGLQLVTRTKALLARKRYWPEVAFLQAPLKVLWVFTSIEWMFVLLLFILNCLTEFASLSYPSLFFPIVLLLYGALRLLVLPHWGLLQDKLVVIDKNHCIRVDPIESADVEEEQFESVDTVSRAQTPLGSCKGGVTSAVYESSDDDDEDEERERGFYENLDRQV